MTDVSPRTPRLPEGITWEFVLVTPELAKRYLSTMHVNRNKSRVEIDVLSQNIEAGTWYAEISPVYIDQGNPALGQDRAWDGQHRFEAIIKTGRSEYLLFIRGISAEAAEYADTGKRRLYNQNLQRRGVPDYQRLGTLAKYVTLHELYGMDGIRYPNRFAVSQPAKDKTIENNVEVMMDSIHLGQALYRKTGLKESWTSYAVYMTGHGKDADGFWTSVLNGENQVKGDPAKTLREWGLRGKKRSRVPVDPRIMELYVVATAWNKHVLGQSWSSVSPRFDKKLNGDPFFPASNVPEYLPLDPALRDKHMGALTAAWKEAEAAAGRET